MTSRKPSPWRRAIRAALSGGRAACWKSARADLIRFGWQPGAPEIDIVDTYVAGEPVWQV
ncbi:MAG: hypothetical protein MO852_00020 [Candidatus Devosia euplotis]|nr:hypothetical protein [Candidatus Devosia euplotis]